MAPSPTISDEPVPPTMAEPVPPTVADPRLARSSSGRGMKIALVVVSLLLVAALVALGYLLMSRSG